MTMDVTFCESEPFYGEKIDLSMLFEGLDHLSPTTDGRDGESIVRLATIAPHATNGQPPSLTIGSLTAPISAPESDDARTIAQPRGQEQPLQVYSRRRRRENVAPGRMLNKGRAIIWYSKSHKCKRKNNLRKVVHLVHRWMRTQMSQRVR
jgi:hypothetical protein